MPNPDHAESGRLTRAERVRAFLGAIITTSPAPRTFAICLKAMSLAQRAATALLAGGISATSFTVKAILKLLVFVKVPVAAAIVVLLLASFASFGITTIMFNVLSSVHTAVHDLTSFNVCNFPLVTLALPACRLPMATVGRADFPSLLAIQHRALDELMSGSTTNSELVLNVKHAELAIRDLVVLVKASNLTTKDPLANTLSQFSVDARRTGRSLQLLISKIRSTVDRAITYNAYALHLLETTCDQTPTPKCIDSAVLRSFEMSLASFATSISSIIVDATKVSASLDALEEQLTTIHALCVQEAWHTAVVEDELLWQLWTLLGGNRRQLWDLANRATVLRDVQQYRALASAYVAATVQALNVVDADLTDLREQLTIHAIDFDRIPVEVQIKSLERSLYRLKDSGTLSNEGAGGQGDRGKLTIQKYLM